MEFVCGRHVVLLPGAEVEADQQAKRIDYGVDLVPKPPRDRPRAWASCAFFCRAPAAWA